MSQIKRINTDLGKTYDVEYAEGKLVDSWLVEDNILEEDFPYNETTGETAGRSIYEKYSDEKLIHWKNREVVIAHDGKHYVTKGNNLVGKMENGYIDPYQFFDGDVFAAVNPNDPNDIIYVKSKELSNQTAQDLSYTDLPYSDPDKPNVYNPIIQDTTAIDQKGQSEWVDYKGSKAYKIEILEELPPVDKEGLNWFNQPQNYDESIRNPHVDKIIK